MNKNKMKKLITKSNEWYDNLPELKRLLFFLIVIMGSLILTMCIFYILNFVWSFIIWASILAFWRCGYIFIKWYDWYKNNEF